MTTAQVFLFLSFGLTCLLSVVFLFTLPSGRISAYVGRTTAPVLPSEKCISLGSILLNVSLTSVCLFLVSHFSWSGLHLPSQELDEWMKEPNGFFWVAALALGFAPFFEELVFRGLIFDGLKQHRIPLKVIQFIQSLLFAGNHGLIQFAGSFAFAWNLGRLRESRPNLRLNFGAHALNNALALSLTYLKMKDVALPPLILAAFCLPSAAILLSIPKSKTLV